MPLYLCLFLLMRLVPGVHLDFYGGMVLSTVAILPILLIMRQSLFFARMMLVFFYGFTLFGPVEERYTCIDDASSKDFFYYNIGPTIAYVIPYCFPVINEFGASAIIYNPQQMIRQFG